jgi:hypothetical protein
MKKVTFVARIFVLLMAVAIVTMSAVPTSEAPPITPEKAKAAVAALAKANSDGKITYHELTTIATELKGEKLTLKERIGIRLFGKKIANKATSSANSSGGKSQLIALLLCAFIGGLGIHRFYLGYTWQGIVQLLTLGGCGIWTLIDFIRIITGSLQPKDGEYETTL